ncbi:MAG: Glycine cleavage system H protein [Lentisphaerae bacterium ADurb.BinA184]|nr:MAG: Glycine cleavage system H protein [Lentisphaerae bacterium ADurb.BinA184]
MRRYSDEHLWVDAEGGVATVGITAYAAAELGDITFVELPEAGAVLVAGESFCVIESAKAATDVIAPCGGVVAEVNARLDDDPGLVNTSPDRDGWICRLREVKPAEIAALLDEAGYEALLAKNEEG